METLHKQVRRQVLLVGASHIAAVGHELDDCVRKKYMAREVERRGNSWVVYINAYWHVEELRSDVRLAMLRVKVLARDATHDEIWLSKR